jgi:hypothetical protein
MKLEKIATEIKFIIAIILESIKTDFHKMDEKSGSKEKKQIIQMMQQLSSILQKLNTINTEDESAAVKLDKEEDLKIIKDFLKNNR